MALRAYDVKLEIRAEGRESYFHQSVCHSSCQVEIAGYRHSYTSFRWAVRMSGEENVLLFAKPQT